MITVYDPSITVTLFKMVQRKSGVSQRYVGLRRQIDLTPLLGEGGSVRTSKSVDGPAGGFTISFPDQPDAFTRDTLYGLIEPMDMIEIRMSRNPGQYAGGKLPLIMRGFVTKIRRVEAMGDDGSPQRFVVISGQDMTKLALISAIYWQELYDSPDSHLVSLWAIGAAIGMSLQQYTAAGFVTAMVGALNKRVAELAALSGQTVQPFTVNATVPDGYVFPSQESALGEGTYWDIMTAFADKPWNEIFVRDLEAGPQIIYRPVPYVDTAGNFIMPGAASPGSVAIDISQVISLDIGRSDERVANIYWVDPGPIILGSGGALVPAALASGSGLDKTYPNNLPTLYGNKIMYATSNLYPDTPNAQAVEPDNQSDVNASFQGWWRQRNNELRLLNRDNSVWEEGAVEVQGSETLQCGMNLMLNRGSLTSTAYMTQVDHTYSPFQSWTSQVQFVRGDGFLVRDRYAGNPFWAEGRLGPYD